MTVRLIRLCARLFVICMFLWGCAGRHVDPGETEFIERPEEPVWQQIAPEKPQVRQQQAPETPQARQQPPPDRPQTRQQPPPAKVQTKQSNVDRRWSMRVITEKEISRMNERDPELTPVVCWEILARLNTKARYYIPDDIKKKVTMKVPNNFSAYKNWTPMPRFISEVSSIPKFILIAKDLPFLGWYQQGKLVGDTQIGIGKGFGWTKAGVYKVLDKDPDHISTVYTNAYGQPAPMPNALRIYDRVWIHTGDVIGGYCSHGCINLPLEPSEVVYNWADKNTVVMILDSLNGLHNALGQYSGFIRAASPAEPKKTGTQAGNVPPKSNMPGISDPKKIFSD